VVAGTAAPVIALAAVVALPSSVSALVDAEVALAQSAKAGPALKFERSLLPALTMNEHEAHRRLGTIGRWIRILTVANMIIQAGLLAVSLSALAVGRDVMPPWIAIVLAVGGILGLAQTLTWFAYFRKTSRHVDEKFGAALGRR
jgi:hypothetical protein